MVPVASVASVSISALETPRRSKTCRGFGRQHADRPPTCASYLLNQEPPPFFDDHATLFRIWFGQYPYSLVQ